MEEFNSISCVLLVSAVLSLAFCTGISFLTCPFNEMSALALPKDNALPLYYDDDDDDDSTTQSDFNTNDERTGEFVPVSIGGYAGYSGLPGISVQQNVTQQNVCSSNTAYCYNEVDNDFNVNPS